MTLQRYLKTFLLGALLSFSAFDPAVAEELDPPRIPAAVEHKPLDAFPDGRVITLYVIGHSQCGPSNRPEFFASVRAGSALLAQQAAASGAAFRAVGVAVDWSPNRGLRFIEKLGPLDEIVTGGSWMNSGAAQVVRIPNGSLATPQLIVVETVVTPSQEGIDISAGALHVNVVGSFAIGAWVQEGAPLSRTSSSK